MNPNWLGVCAAILSLASFFVSFRLGAKARNRPRQLLAALAILLAIPGASFAIYYAHILPEPSWWYEFRSRPATEFFIVPIGIAGGLVAAILPRFLLVLPLFGVAAFSIAPFVKPFIGPFAAGALSDRWEDGICLQSTGSTCGAASLATIMKRFGEAVTEPELAAEAHSYRNGTEAWYLARAARRRGFEVAFDFRAGLDPEVEFPAVAGVRFGSIGHFIPILGREGDEFLIGDPLRGRESLTSEELLERYRFTGFFMKISKPAE